MDSILIKVFFLTLTRNKANSKNTKALFKQKWNNISNTILTKINESVLITYEVNSKATNLFTTNWLNAFPHKVKKNKYLAWKQRRTEKLKINNCILLLKITQQRERQIFHKVFAAPWLKRHLVIKLLSDVSDWKLNGVDQLSKSFFFSSITCGR